MRTMVLTRVGARQLEPTIREIPVPSPHQVLVKVRACGVCRTDLHVVDGELAQTTVPVIPGHEIVGTVERLGAEVRDVRLGERMGVPWLGWTCGVCAFCLSGRENLCPRARFTGCQLDGGYAEYALADARYCFPLPAGYDDVHAAPLLCAGLIGYRAYRMIGDGRRLGIYGFGAAAHIITQVAVADRREVYAFVAPGDENAARFARDMGSAWSGSSEGPPPVPLDAAIIFAPVGRLVPEALSRVAPGGVVVCAGIHMSDIPSFPYHLLWQERSVRSVANLTRQDAHDFLALAARVPLRTEVHPYAL